ncbi:hypothetical protein GCM10010198_50120 [Nocardia seriolae]|nr:hypothetical protein D6158_20245 [Nocardia seriolae]BEK87857.1 hypothetical protein NSERKGN1266_38080 [Nocardia seriolae]GEM25679.1 hypothetical protein NS2_39180 [Nocardia seriolae NBRC 15557]
MNGNSIPPGYHRNDELWNQNTEVFEPVRGDYGTGSSPRGGGGPKKPQTSKYLIIGLSVTIVVCLLAIGGLLLSGHGSWNAAPNAATGTTGPRVVLTPPPHTSVTTTTQSAGSATTPDATTPRPSPTTTTAVTTTPATIAAQAPCEQPGTTATTSDGTVLTCVIAGDDTTHWMPVSKPTAGSACAASESGTFAYAPNGTQLVCSRRAGSTTPVYVWDNPGTLTTGIHDPGQVCNLTKDVIAQSSSGRAVYCLPTNNPSNGQYIGNWKYQP